MKLRNLSEMNKKATSSNLDLSRSHLTVFPDGLPKRTLGSFSCIDNRLTSLKGCPEEIGGNFLCGFNGLTSLEFCPKRVGQRFSCVENGLISLEGIHKNLHEVGQFVCYDNPIKSHVLGLMLINVKSTASDAIKTSLGSDGDVDMILNKWKNQGRRGVLGAQRELLDLGYKELAQL